MFARSGNPKGSSGSAIGERVVVVGYPLPNIASQVEVSVGASSCWLAAYPGGDGATEYGQFVRRFGISPRVHAAVRTTSCPFPFGFRRKSPTKPAAVGRGVLMGDSADGLERVAKFLVGTKVVGGSRSLAVRATYVGFDAASIPLVGHFGLVEQERFDPYPVGWSLV